MENEKQIDKKQNCFTLVRYIAAINVFLLHMSHLVSVPDNLDILIRCIHGIPIFFTLSGFLIWMSLETTSEFKPFFQKRVFRLYPELWGGVVFNAIVMIILFKNNIEWKSFSLFQFTQASIFQQWTPTSLREYGCGTPNGVLGSISVLLQSYVCLWLLYKILHGKKLLFWIVAFVASIITAAVFPLLGNVLTSLIYKILDATVITSFRMFLLGALVAEYFDIIIPFLKKTWWIFLIIYVVLKYSSIPDIEVNHPIFRTIFIGLATLGFGYAFPTIRIKTDITYGIFIYHMIVINALIEMGFVNSFYSALISFFITVFLALISSLTLGRLGKKLKVKMEKQ